MLLSLICSGRHLRAVTMRLGLAGAISGPGLALLAGVMAPPHDTYISSELWLLVLAKLVMLISYY